MMTTRNVWWWVSRGDTEAARYLAAVLPGLTEDVSLRSVPVLPVFLAKWYGLPCPDEADQVIQAAVTAGLVGCNDGAYHAIGPDPEA